MGREPSMKASDWDHYSTTRGVSKASSAHDIYHSSKMDSKYDPKNISVRESRDSADHPESTPIIIGLDVTGSMGDILTSVAKKLGPMVLRILEKQPVSDPQVMFNAIGDSAYGGDNAPLQVTQFESDIRIAEQLTALYFEGGGGGNSFESYPLTWYLAANKTSIDSFEKRGKKGFIFTMGDDGCPTELKAREIAEVFGDTAEESVDVKSLLNQVNRQWEVFHIYIKSGGYNDGNRQAIWKDLLGERCIVIDRDNYDKIPEIIVSTLETMNGKSISDVVASWDGVTGAIVRSAIGGLKPSNNAGSTGLVEFD